MIYAILYFLVIPTLLLGMTVYLNRTYKWFVKNDFCNNDLNTIILCIIGFYLLWPLAIVLGSIAGAGYYIYKKFIPNEK